jgi:hypothetical protein
VELLLLWAVIDALSLVIVEPPMEDVVKPLLLVVVGADEEIVLVVGVDEEIVLVVVVDGGLLATVVLLATKVVPGTMYPEASTQLPGAMFALPEVKHAWPTAHDQAWFVPRIKPQHMCSTSRQISPQAR